MATPKGTWIGARKTLSRGEAIEEYIILRLRYEDIKRLDYLLIELHHRRIALPLESPFSTRDLADTVRTCLFGWFATLTDRDERAVLRIQLPVGIISREESAHRQRAGFLGGLSRGAPAIPK